MRLLLVFLLLIAVAHGLTCSNYAKVIQGRGRERAIPRMRDAPLGTNTKKECGSNEHCTMYYYYITDGKYDNYVMIWGDCWSRDQHLMDRCDVHRDGEDLGEGYKAFIVGCACKTDNCLKPEEANNNWDEKLSLFGEDFYHKALATYGPRKMKFPTSAMPQNTGGQNFAPGGNVGGYQTYDGSPGFSTISLLFITVLAVFFH